MSNPASTSGSGTSIMSRSRRETRNETTLWYQTSGADQAKPGADHFWPRLLVYRKALTHGKFIDRDKRRRPVVPVRFVRACRRGHISDIDWHAFVHVGPPPHRLQLYIDERGTSGDLSEVWVRCECGQER